MPKPVQQTGAKPTIAGRKPTIKVGAPAKPKPPSILERIKPIGFDPDDGIKMLVYGRSGTGKTTFWSSFPGKILAVICSGSDKPGELRSVDTAVNREKIDQVVLQRSEELLPLSAYLSESSDYTTVVIDHLSALQDKMLAELLGIEKVPEQKSWGLASQQTWGVLSGAIKEYMRSFLSLSQNVVFVAQERVFGNSSEDNASEFIRPSVGPNLSPQTAAWLCPAVDYIVHTFLRQHMEESVQTIGKGEQAKKVTTRRAVPGQVDYCLRTGPNEMFITKFRVPDPKTNPVPAEIVDADFDKMMELIRGGQ